MVKRRSIEFVKTDKPITELVTKFGGEPVWLGKPEWPLSKSTGNPMRFICQIAIDQTRFSPVAARMAYLFMTDEDEFVDGTWEPHGGENAVILQPDETTFKTAPLTDGPSLYQMVQKPSAKLLVPEPCEFSVVTNDSEDPDLYSDAKPMTCDDTRSEANQSAFEGNKIGGSPMFVQNEEYPGPGSWRLLLQIDSCKVPFYLNFGDGGVGYIFLSEDGKTAKFLWQCS